MRRQLSIKQLTTDTTFDDDSMLILRATVAESESQIVPVTHTSSNPWSDWSLRRAEAFFLLLECL
jgi:hypothetical protein